MFDMNKLIEKLLKNPGNFDFFQAVRLLEEYYNMINIENKSDLSFLRLH